MYSIWTFIDQQSRLFLLSLALMFGLSLNANADTRELLDQFRTKVRPLIENYCLDCHRAEDASGGIRLDAWENDRAILSHVKTWQLMAEVQQQKRMPPEDYGIDPTPEERQTLIDWATSLADALDQAEPSDPGPTRIRRLTRRQYANSIRDLTGLELDVAARVGLPSDPVAFGFDSMAAVLDVPPVIMEKYAAAADEVLDRIILDKPLRHTHTAQDLDFKLLGEMPDRPSKDGPNPDPAELTKGYRILRVTAETTVSVDVPFDGAYRITLFGWGHKGPPWVQWRPELGIKLDGRLAKTVILGGTREQPSSVSTTIHLAKGPAKIGIAFLNPIHGPNWSSNEHRWRHVGLERVTLTGPVASSAEEVSEEANAKVFFTRPSDTVTDEAAAREVVERFASRAWRRPISATETDRLLSLYRMAREMGLGFESAVRPVLKVVLMSPSFIYRIEGLADEDQTGVVAVTDHELATRLSYFLWGTLPDEELTRLASVGQLQRDEVLIAQVKRMLDDPRSRWLTDDFASQWLGLDELADALPSEEFFPEFDAAMRASMRDEIRTFFAKLIEHDRPITDLIDSDYTYLNRQLALFYRFGGLQNGPFREEKIDKRRHPYRGGLLGMGGVLAMTSHVSRNSPTRRGKWVLDVLKGQPPPPPPDNVEQIDEGGDLAAARTFRELLKRHADESGSCAGCHRKMDPLGFALDNFSPIGRWETNRAGQKIDAKGVLPNGRQIDGVVELKAILLEEKDDFARNLTEQMLTYALGRELDYTDRASVARIVDRLKANDYQVRELIMGVVESYPFRNRRTEREGER